MNYIFLNMHKMGKRIIDLKTDDTLYIGDAKVQLIKKSGQLARIRVVADNHIEIIHKRMSASDSDDTETQDHGKHAL
ncbi:hypothetical protein [Acinetobacter bereziniae]|uniref:hypothetical protein n=1 Tax=Acinetobacter bereziniae TaxID=106648 RepID=UPI001D0E9A0B|nr:hypothetical protein [Acinetobacter bereziniae]WMW72946.1 hypothetical protein RG306_11620 [Acinetobacter bereziniae]